MKVTFSVVPPGGGEQDYSFVVDIPTLPETGDYVTAFDKDGRAEYFIVRRRWFCLNVEKRTDENDYNYRELVVEVEFAKGPFPTDDHGRACQMYEHRGKVPREFEDTCY